MRHRPGTCRAGRAGTAAGVRRVTRRASCCCSGRTAVVRCSGGTVRPRTRRGMGWSALRHCRAARVRRRLPQRARQAAPAAHRFGSRRGGRSADAARGPREHWHRQELRLVNLEVKIDGKAQERQRVWLGRTVDGRVNISRQPVRSVRNRRLTSRSADGRPGRAATVPSRCTSRAHDDTPGSICSTSHCAAS